MSDRSSQPLAIPMNRLSAQALPVDTPVMKMLGSRASKGLTPKASRLTKEDLIRLYSVSPSEMGLDADDVASIRATFADAFRDANSVLEESTGRALPGGSKGASLMDSGGIDISCCCCTPCCCAAASMEPVEQVA